MTRLHFRPAPQPGELPIEDRLVFPRPSRPVRLRLSDPLEALQGHAASSNAMHDSGMWMDACFDQVQNRLDAVRTVLDSFDGDDEGPRAA